MKSFKLFKRLGAFVTAVAVLASMGTVAFATDTDTPVAPTIEIGDVTIEAKEVENGEGVYTITVPYNFTGDIGDMGVTMLAYTKGNTDDDLAAEGVETTGFTPYKSDYKIAYVTQENPIGLISFNIDTTGEKAIEVGTDEKILILLGGDGVVAPAATLVTTPWKAEEAQYVFATGGYLDAAVAYDYSDAKIKEAVIDAISATSIQVSGDNDKTTMVTEFGRDLTAEDITIADEEDALTDATHTVTLTLPEETILDDSKAILAGDVTVTIPICVTKTPWIVNEIAFGDGTAMIDSSTNPGLTPADFLTYVTNNIVKTGSATLALAGANGETGSYTIAAADANVAVAWAGAAPESIVEGTAYDITITLNTTAELDATINLTEAKAETLAVTYKLDTRKAISEINATKNEAAVTATVVPEAATKAEIITAVKAALQGATYTAAYEGGTEVVTVVAPENVADWTITNTEGTPDSTEAETDLAPGNYYATFVVSTLSGTDCKVVEPVTVKIAVTVSTPWACGDVNHSGKVDINDVIALARYVAKNPPENFDADLANINDINNTKVDINDVIALAKHVAKSEPIIPYSKRP